MNLIECLSSPRSAVEPTAELADGELPAFDAASSAIASKASVVTVLLGVLVLAGWFLGITVLTTIVVGGAAMKANAAFGFVLAGASLWCGVRRAPRPWHFVIASSAAVLVALLGAATLAQYLFRWNLGIDELLVVDEGLVYQPAPGRLAPVTAANFLLLGIALGVVRSQHAVARGLAEGLTLLVLFVSMFALVGYAYGVSSMYRLPPYSSMALLTAATFAVLCVGILYARRDFSIMAPLRSSSPGGVMARMLLPAILIIPLLAWLRLQGEQAGYYGREMGLAFSTSKVILFLMVIVWWCARSLNRVDTERRRVTLALRDSERIYRAIGESIDYGIWLCTADGRNVYASASFLNLVGITQKECSEFGWGNVLHPDDAETTIAAWKACVRAGGNWDREHRFRGVDGKWHSVLARGVPVTDENGNLLCLAGINLDISRLKRVEQQLKQAFDDLEIRIQERTAELTTVNEMLRQSLEEKEVLLREVHHRVKNNLQVVSSLLHLQSLHTCDAASAEMFQESQSRVRSMALVHERLYRSKDLAQVEFTEYIQGLATSLFQSYKIDSSRISLETNVHAVRLAIDTAVPCGLLINELVSNCLKHAFVGRELGRVRIDLCSVTENEILLSVGDDGIGLPSDVDLDDAETFGLQVVAALVEQLHGELDVRRDAGTEFRILFPRMMP